MQYVDGFVVAVPADRKQKYLDLATRAAAVFKDYGATRVVECWGDDVPEGKLTDFRGAVKAEPGEIVVFSWIEYPSREARDRVNQEAMKDPRLSGMEADMPFDGKRMIFGGFVPLLDQ
ncbi:MAG: DUF1428 domain-containing protein [Comamonadaceae bacterium]|nr:MAG: DUF1428 domain-containing protein [Comamonadaceae bacterium]